MPTEQIFIGLVTSALCGIGLYREFWFLTETNKGRWLVEKCGLTSALWILRGLLTLGVIFGLSLAMGIINPVRW
ncbi:MAG: hypothetical protein KDA93_08445 [Planctomycetaceae bacterium]|nr:hypothetical protein [Planctomycetaceae bacterium]